MEKGLFSQLAAVVSIKLTNCSVIMSSDVHSVCGVHKMCGVHSECSVWCSVVYTMCGVHMECSVRTVRVRVGCGWLVVSCVWCGVGWLGYVCVWGVGSMGVCGGVVAHRCQGAEVALVARHDTGSETVLGQEILLVAQVA